MDSFDNSLIPIIVSIFTVVFFALIYIIFLR